ncbi:MAG: phosphoglycerate dehydrogenase [Desulfacinum sp.]|nr:phosphoglycerate dehydrogenase [Desulfacinum sp.]
MWTVLITPKSYYEVRKEMEPLLKGCRVIYNETGRTLTEEEMCRLASRADGILVGVDPVSRRVIESAPRLKAVSKYGVGVDNIDREALEERGIPLTTTPGANNVSVAELTVGLLFVLARNLYAAAAEVKAGGWSRVRGTELTGKTLGLVGCGGIGREVARRARGLLMKVCFYDPYFQEERFIREHELERLPLEELLAVSDFVSLHVPLTGETRKLMNRERLERMKPGAYLVNTARGELVDEEALYWALSSGRLAGAACDVFSQEPPGDHPLLRLDNFLLTPHVGAHTHEAVTRMAKAATENLLRLLAASGGSGPR